MKDSDAKLQRKAKRLIKDEYVIWMTTVDSKLTPQPRPVWFIWDKDSFLIFSEPHAYKVQHLSKHPRVSLHFNSDQTGDRDVVVFVGTASLDSTVAPAHKVRAYFKKYQTGIADLGMRPEEFSEKYSAAIRVTPTALRGW
jgi:PPOX class probable F420-dependent enzyme